MKKLTIDIISACNLDCSFCYQRFDGRLSKEDIKRIVNENNEFDYIEIGGGEPFMHLDLADILNELVNQDKSVHISTNATFIPKALLDLEEKVRNRVTIQTSLHAGNKETYKTITGMDYFDKVINNIKILNDNYNTVLNAVIYQTNYEEIKDILKIAYDLNVSIRINLAFPIGKGQDVELLSNAQVDRLKGLLFVEKINHPNLIDSPLIHEINCPMLSEAYGLPKTGACPLEIGAKRYYNPTGCAFGCEFYKMKG